MAKSSDDKILTPDNRTKFLNYIKHNGIARINGCPMVGFDSVFGAYLKYDPQTGKRAWTRIEGLTADGTMTWGQALDLLWNLFNVGKTLTARWFGEDGC